MPGPDPTQPATSPDQPEPSVSADEEREMKAWDDQRLQKHWEEYAQRQLDLEQNRPYQSPTGDRQFQKKINQIINRYYDSLVPQELTTSQTGGKLRIYAQSGTGKDTTPPVVGVAQAADPVNLFNGSFAYAVTDCTINGAGLDFAFTRTYAQAAFYSGPLGINWDHSANLWLRLTENGRTVFASTGTLRTDAYVRHDQHDYWVPPNGVAAVLVEDGASFSLRHSDGRRIVYQPHPSFGPTIHVAARVEDRFGNQLGFEYQDGRLARVTVNHPDRTVDFEYDTEDRVTAVRDFTGRVWRYSYDDLGDLAAVTLPLTPEYPRGLTTRYEYSTTATSDRALQHHLTGIYDADGLLYLENAYGETPGLLSYGRVIRQRQGGGEVHFDYEDVIESFDEPYGDHERPTHQTVITERDGRQLRYLFNRFGNMLLRQEYARLDGVPKVVTTHYRYNQDGNLIGTLTPLGVLTQALYGRDLYERRFPPADPEAANHPEQDANLTPEARLQFPQLLAVVTRGRYHPVSSLNLALGLWSNSLFPDVLDTSAEDTLQKFTYEPEFSQPLTISDPRFTRSPDPAFVEDAEYHRHLTRFTYSPGAGFQHLLLAAVEAPTPTLPDGTPGGTVTTRYLEYDDRGRLVRGRIPNGTPEGLEIGNEYAPPGGPQEGYLLATTHDPGGLNVRSAVERDDLGRVVSAFRPPFFEHQDGRYITRSTYNALGQLIESTGTAPFSLRTRHRYTRGGSLRESEQELRDAENALEGVLVTCNRYDEELHLVSVTTGGNLAGEAEPAFKTARILYDRAGRPFLSIAPSGRKHRAVYNERSRPHKSIEDYGGVHAITRMFYDADARLVRVIDPGGAETRFSYDVFGRLVQIQDPLGNRVLRQYDKRGNLLAECVFESTGTDAFVLRSRHAFEFDELGRRTLAGCNRFDQVPAVDAAQLASFLTAGPGPFLAMRLFYDDIGNLVRRVDPDGREHRVQYDALSRPVSEVDPLGNRQRYRYDLEGNLLRVDREEVTLDPATHAVTARRHFAQTFRYDELNRLVENRWPSGSLRYRYDSRGNAVAMVDALDHPIETRFDIFSREVEIRRFLHRHQPGEVPVPVITQLAYNRDDQVTHQTDALGRVTQFRYDSAGRLVSTILPDGSSDTSTYDRLGNCVEYVNRRGVTHRLQYDALGRNTILQVAPGGAADFLGAVEYHCSYDVLGRITQAGNEFVVTRLAFDSLGGLVEEETAFAAASGLSPNPQRIRREFTNSGALNRIVYPSGREIRYTRDALDRVTAVTQVAKGAAYPGAAALPEAVSLATLDYEGLQRKRITRHGGLSTTFAFDFAGRVVEIAHAFAGSPPVLKQQTLYDALGNMCRRLEVGPGLQAAESFEYDSLLQLYGCGLSTSAAMLDLAGIAPPTAPLPDVLPDLQGQVDTLIAGVAVGPTEVLDYDLVGNRTTSSFAGGQSYHTNALDQYVQVGSETLRYDGDGNRTEDGLFRYRYDHRSQPCLVERKADARATRFFYDYFGRRIGEQGGEAARLVYDGHTLIEEYRQDQLTRSVVSAGELDDLLTTAGSGRDLTLLADLNCSVRAAIDGSQVHALYSYDPFGNLRSAPPPGDDTLFGFAGKPRLGGSELHASGLYDFVYRTYDPAVGRFLQRDPKGYVDGTNMYPYAMNNPLALRDPLGLESRAEHASALVPARMRFSDSQVLGGPGALLSLGEPSEPEAAPESTDPSGGGGGADFDVKMDVDCGSRRGQRTDCIALFQRMFTGSTSWEGTYVPTAYENDTIRKWDKHYYPIYRQGAVGIDALVGWRLVDVWDPGGDGAVFHDVTREGQAVGTDTIVWGSGDMTPGFGASILDPSSLLAGKLATSWLRSAVTRSGIDDFAFRAIAQDARQLTNWNLALRTVAARPGSNYARTLGQNLTKRQARRAFNEVRKEFLSLEGVTGWTHNVHHWNRLSKFPELALDPRNLFLLDSGIVGGSRVGQHIFVHWVTHSGNPYSGLSRPGAVLELGFPQSVIQPLARGR